MTLQHKIIALLSFMFIVTLMVFYWFTTHMNRHVNNFRQSLATEKQQLEMKMKERIDKLLQKAENLGDEVTSHLSSMEDGLKQRQKESEEFADQFLERQNLTFDAIDGFSSRGRK